MLPVKTSREVTTCPETLVTTRNSKKKTRTRICPKPPKEAQPCQHLVFKLVRNTSEKIDPCCLNSHRNLQQSQALTLALGLTPVLLSTVYCSYPAKEPSQIRLLHLWVTLPRTEAARTDSSSTAGPREKLPFLPPLQSTLTEPTSCFHEYILIHVCFMRKHAKVLVWFISWHLIVIHIKKLHLVHNLFFSTQTCVRRDMSSKGAVQSSYL